MGRFNNLGLISFTMKEKQAIIHATRLMARDISNEGFGPSADPLPPQTCLLKHMPVL